MDKARPERPTRVAAGANAQQAQNGHHRAGPPVFPTLGTDVQSSPSPREAQVPSLHPPPPPSARLCDKRWNPLCNHSRSPRISQPLITDQDPWQGPRGAARSAFGSGLEGARAWSLAARQRSILAEESCSARGSHGEGRGGMGRSQGHYIVPRAQPQ